MFFVLVSINLVIYIVSIMKFIEGNLVYGFSLAGAGLLFSIIIMVIYNNRRSEKNNGTWLNSLDCSFIDCHGDGTDCDCGGADCSP